MPPRVTWIAPSRTRRSFSRPTFWVRRSCWTPAGSTAFSVMRYAIDPTKIHNELGWLPETKFADGIDKTIDWYLTHRDWWENIINGEYQHYYERMYGNL